MSQWTLIVQGIAILGLCTNGFWQYSINRSMLDRLAALESAESERLRR